MGDRPYTILFVEYDSAVRASTAEVLSAKGFRLIVAQDGYEAMRLLSENEVDVLFTDIVMPGPDGIALAKQAKILRPDLKIMFMTSYYSRAMDAMVLGTLMFKPLRGQEIADKLEKLFRGEPTPL